MSVATGAAVTEGMFDSSRLAKIIRRWSVATRYTAAMASSASIAKYVQKPFAPSVQRVWIDLIDVDSQKLLDRSNLSRFPMSWGYGLEGRRLRQLEIQLARTADRLLVSSQTERNLFRDICPDAAVQVIPNGVDTEYFTPIKHDVIPHSCVFFGVLDDPASRAAVRWFSETVWPKVRQRFSDSTFRIVGGNPGLEIQQLSALPGVSVVGPVADVRPWLNESHCVVVPPSVPNGAQSRILEAMASGCPVVCSTSSVNGLGVEPGLQLLQANSTDEWVEAVSAVFNDQNLARELGIAAGAWAQVHHLWDACLAPLAEMLDVGRPAAGYEIEVTP
jgi:polysaccharide biosynthesis protein PslH